VPNLFGKTRPCGILENSILLALFPSAALEHSSGVFIRLWVLCGLEGATSLRANDGLENQHFLQQLEPLLDSCCISCHGPEKQKGSVRPDSRSATLEGGDNGPTVAPVNPAESVLLHLLLHTKPDLGMTPKEKLTKKDNGVLEQWIRNGVSCSDAVPSQEALLRANPSEMRGLPHAIRPNLSKNSPKPLLVEVGPNQTNQVERGVQLAYQRSVTSDERRICLEFLKTHSLPELARPVLNSNEFIYLD
jgi:hypothetical protein